MTLYSQIKIRRGEPMRIILSNHSQQPIYEQIKEQIKEQILTGEMVPGQELASIRQLAKELKISVITTSRAYTELEAEGFIATRAGKGSIVLERDNEMIKEQYLKKVEESLMQIIQYARMIKIPKEEVFRMYELLDDEE
jgi:GntR family transcriptional regulator